MQFEGSHTFAASPQKLWDLLNDPEVLQRTTPGIQTLERDGADRFKAVMHIKMGPVNGQFNGTLQVVDKNEPNSYRLLIEVDGKIGHIKAEGSVWLEAEGENTLLRVQSGSQLSGKLARMGQRLLSGIARMFTKQFFQALEKELESQ
jgi:carbon monoxide dehydrogenase subunit G